MRVMRYGDMMKIFPDEGKKIYFSSSPKSNYNWINLNEKTIHKIFNEYGFIFLNELKEKLNAQNVHGLSNETNNYITITRKIKWAELSKLFNHYYELQRTYNVLFDIPMYIEER